MYSSVQQNCFKLLQNEIIHDLDMVHVLIVIGILLRFLSARGNCGVWEGGCAAGGLGEVDGTGLLRMDPLSEGRAAQTLGASGAGDQRDAGGPPPLPGQHPDQRTQLQRCPTGEGTAGWASAETHIYFVFF